MLGLWSGSSIEAGQPPYVRNPDVAAKPTYFNYLSGLWSSSREVTLPTYLKKPVAALGSAAITAGLLYGVYKGSALGGKAVGSYIGSPEFARYTGKITGALGAVAAGWYYAKPTVSVVYAKLSGKKLTEKASIELLGVLEDYSTVLEFLMNIKYEWHQLHLKIQEKNGLYVSKERAPIRDAMLSALDNNITEIDHIITMSNDLFQENLLNLADFDRPHALENSISICKILLDEINETDKYMSALCPTKDSMQDLVRQRLYDGAHTTLWNRCNAWITGGRNAFKHGHDRASNCVETVNSFYTLCSVCYKEIQAGSDAAQKVVELNGVMQKLVAHAQNLSTDLSPQLKKAAKTFRYFQKLEKIF